MTTRICVKNIPKHVNEARLREHFSAKGEVTDVKILRTSDGRSRQLAFLGFRSADQAAQCLKYFHQSYLDTSKLQVEAAHAVGASEAPRAWSKYSQGSSAHAKLHKPPPGPADLAATAGGGKAGGKGAEKTATKKGKKGQFGSAEELEDEDAGLSEFLEVMKPRQKSKLWTNDDITTADMSKKENPQSKKTTASNKASSKMEIDDSENESDDEYIELDEEKNVTASDNSDDDDDDDDDDEKAMDVADAGISDMDYLRNRVKANFSDDDEDDEGPSTTKMSMEDDDDEDNDEEEEDSGDGVKKSSGKKVKYEGKQGVKTGKSSDVEDTTEAPPKEPLNEAATSGREEPGRLFVRNLSYGMTEAELRDIFEPFGDLSEVHLVKDRQTGQSKGFAYILFMLPEQAENALHVLDKSVVQGRLLHVMAAHRPPPKPEPKDQPLKPGMSKFKQEKNEALKAGAGNQQAWNALFMRQDTVAAAVAAHFGVSKSALLDPTAGDSAVRMALGEVQVIAATKDALAEAGVDIALLERAAAGGGRANNKTGATEGSTAPPLPRSSSVLLVKNLPFEVTAEDLANIFGKFGSIGPVILPPTRTLALIEFLQPSDAKRAFKACAYKRVGKVPIYLEWAPEGILGDNQEGEKISQPKTKETVSEEDDLHEENADSRERSEGVSTPAVSGSATVFVKNLAFKTDSKSLERHLRSSLPASCSASLMRCMVKTRPAPGEGGQVLSCGYAFVTFKDADSAGQAIATLQNSKLDGHTLSLETSSRPQKSREVEAEGPQKKSKKGFSATKIIVRNLAFEATKKDMGQLFSPFGQLKSVRVPRKFDGSHRGFAFVEFVTKKEAASAFEAVKETHLYGRHLVLEYAKEEEGLDELRAKASAQFTGKKERDDTHSTKGPKSKKAKFLSGLDDATTSFNSTFAG